jgi:hypothetical protein
MNRARKFLLVAFILTTVFVGSTLVANAVADLTEGFLYCDHLEANGTSDAPYVTLYAYNDSTAEAFYTILPVTGGVWSGSVSFPAVAEGTLFLVRAWGTVAPYSDFSDPNYYDGDPYFEGYANCALVAPPEVPEEPGEPGTPPVALVVSCTNPLPSDSVVYDVPFGAPAYFNPDLQSSTNFSLPAGTWKISEFKDDFAKVWIACEANPIWIPSGAVGGAVG